MVKNKIKRELIFRPSANFERFDASFVPPGSPLNGSVCPGILDFKVDVFCFRNSSA
jgi:hypothetical protein